MLFHCVLGVYGMCLENFKKTFCVCIKCILFIDTNGTRHQVYMLIRTDNHRLKLCIYKTDIQNSYTK